VVPEAGARSLAALKTSGAVVDVLEAKDSSVVALKMMELAAEMG
jgi:hypothetical protein